MPKKTKVYETEMTLPTLKSLDPNGTYLVSVHISKNEKDPTSIINKVELAFKVLGIKNVKAIPFHFSVYEIKENQFEQDT